MFTDNDNCTDNVFFDLNQCKFIYCRCTGTLQIFAGRYSLHRVTKITSSATTDRPVAVFCYRSEPGIINSPAAQDMLWGRLVAPGK